MKYRFFITMCLVSVLLTGCDTGLISTIETIPVSASDPVIINTIEAGYEAIEVVVNEDDKRVVISSVDYTTVDESFSIPGLEKEILHLNSTDENYLFEVAYHTGDTSLLNENEKAMLEVVKDILAAYENQSDYDTAIGVHDKLIELVSYDFSDNQYNAYGALIEGKAVCQGYAAAYKLCMDLADIPCITVGGTVEVDGEMVNHAWNMVKVNGQWSHVDVTWDDPVTSSDMGSWKHLYLFASDSFMKNDHSWDTLVQGLHGVKTIPEAKDEYSLYLLDGYSIKSQSELMNSFLDKFNQGQTTFEFLCIGFEPDAEFVALYNSCSYIKDKVGDMYHIYISLL